MKRLLARFIVPAVAAMGVAAPAFAGKSTLVVGPGVVVHLGGHRGHVEHRLGHHHRKSIVLRDHRLHGAKLRHGKPHHGKRLRHEKRWRRHDRRDAGLHRRPLSRHFSHGRHGAEASWRRRGARQFFHGRGVTSPHHGRRFSSGRRSR